MESKRDRQDGLFGAGEGNRTLILSMGSSRSAIELRPHGKMILPSRPRGFKVIQLSVNGQVQRLEPGANVARLLEALELAESAWPWKRTARSCRGAAMRTRGSPRATRSKSSWPSAEADAMNAPTRLAEQIADPLLIAGRAYRSRLLIGTGKYRDFDETRRAVEASGAEIVTVAIRRTNIGQNANEPSLLDALPPSRFTILPNTAGCYTAQDAVRSRSTPTCPRRSPRRRRWWPRASR